MRIQYIGQMTEPGSMGGLYPSPYRLPDGELRFGFETMMQPMMARAVFPCFDEPALKANFTVSLIVDSDLTCLSNMEVAREERIDDPSGEEKKIVTFQETPKMPTYLVVLVGGYFNFIETNDFHIPVRVLGSSGQGHHQCHVRPGYGGKGSPRA